METRLNTLVDMLAYRRPASSKSERRFIQRFITPLGVEFDGAGNAIKRIGDAPILWSSHTDTVHRTKGTQRLLLRGDTIRLPRRSGSNCLGADNGAGVWLMREMILAGVPGLYVFHRAEEIGGLGSEYIAKHRKTLLNGIKAAIAFDRRGTQSIITHQWGGRCCSDRFANSLSLALGMNHARDNGGTFTDTANYTDLIGECSNISAGFRHEHTTEEYVETGYLLALRAALIALDWRWLEFEREPGDYEPKHFSLDNYSRQGWKVTRKNGAKVLELDPTHLYPAHGREEPEELPFGQEDNDDLFRKLIRDNPDEIMDILHDYGLSLDLVAQEVFEKGGAIPHELLSAA